MRRSAFAIGLLLLAACGRADPLPLQTEDVVSTAPSVSHAPGYIEVTDHRIPPTASGHILFFHQAGDPFSDRSHLLLQKLYASGSAKLSTYALDVSRSTGAKLEFGVLVSDTFVVIDASGSVKASIIHPTREQIQILAEKGIITPLSE